MKNKHIFIIVFCIIFVLLFSYVGYLFKDSIDTLSNESITPTIIIDAGHGGEDGGAVGIDGTSEKNLNLDIANKLEAILKLYGYNTIMTRTTDTMISDENLTKISSKKISDIHNRFNIIVNNPDALFVSIHQNKFHDSNQHGTQVFYSKNNEKSKLLAQSIQSSVIKLLQPSNKRIVKKTGTEIYLLYHAQSVAVLVECGFLSNYSDLQKIKTNEYKFQMALSIADGIIKYNSNR